MKSTLSEFTRAFFYKNIYIIYTFLFFYLYPSQINQLTIVFLSRKIFSGIQLSCILSITNWICVMDQPPRLIETIVSWILESNDNLSGVKIIPLEQPSMIESSTNSLLLVLLQDSKRTITIKKKDPLIIITISCNFHTNIAIIIY